MRQSEAASSPSYFILLSACVIFSSFSSEFLFTCVPILPMCYLVISVYCFSSLLRGSSCQDSLMTGFYCCSLLFRRLHFHIRSTIFYHLLRSFWKELSRFPCLRWFPFFSRCFYSCRLGMICSPCCLYWMWLLVRRITLLKRIPRFCTCTSSAGDRLFHLCII